MTRGLGLNHPRCVSSEDDGTRGKRATTKGTPPVGPPTFWPSSGVLPNEEQRARVLFDLDVRRELFDLVGLGDDDRAAASVMLDSIRDAVGATIALIAAGGGPLEAQAEVHASFASGVRSALLRARFRVPRLRGSPRAGKLEYHSLVRREADAYGAFDEFLQGKRPLGWSALVPMLIAAAGCEPPGVWPASIEFGDLVQAVAALLRSPGVGSLERVNVLVAQRAEDWKRELAREHAEVAKKGGEVEHDVALLGVASRTEVLRRKTREVRRALGQCIRLVRDIERASRPDSEHATDERAPWPLRLAVHRNALYGLDDRPLTFEMRLDVAKRDWSRSTTRRRTGEKKPSKKSSEAKKI